MYLHTIYAEEIIQMINVGEDVNLYDFHIFGDIDLRTLDIIGNGTKDTIDSRINIINSVIYGSIYFANICFKEPIEIKETKIWGSVDFTYAKLMRNSCFDDTIFYNNSSFIKTIFEDTASFVGTKFFAVTSFDGAIFNQNVSFESAEFKHNGVFNSAKFENEAAFNEATFYEVASFREGIFKGSARFIGTIFILDAFFNKSKFIRDVSFRKSKFFRCIDFSEAKILREANFTDIIIEGKINLDKCRIKNVNISWDNINNHLIQNDYIYTNLKRNFRELNRADDEDECYLQYRRWILKNRKRKVLWFIDKAADWSCGYGSKPQNLFIISLIIIFIFSVVYYIGGFADVDYKFLLINSNGSFELSINSSNEFPMDVYKSLYFSAMTYLGKKVNLFELPHILWVFILLETLLGYLSLGILISCIYRIFTRGLDP
jgi:uncharacterized protein YjbI with pentapeptide repeats